MTQLTVQSLERKMADVSDRPRLLLFNPPGTKKYIRDYFCAKIAKSFYYYHPTDLVYLSGPLSSHFDVSFVDAIAESLDRDAAIQRVRNLEPDWIVYLTAGISYAEDLETLSAIKAAMPQVRFVGTGDIYREITTQAFQDLPFLDAITLDFSTDDLLSYFQRQAADPIPNIIYRTQTGLVEGKESHGHGKFHIDMPRWDLVNLNLYSYPFERRRQFASVLTDFGCPYKCTFCPLSTVGFKLRDLPEVEKELHYLKSRGVKDIYFRDQTFGVNKKRTIELCDLLATLDIGWTCFTRVDVLSEELVVALKRGGCHTVMFGIESVDAGLMQAYKKNTTAEQAQAAVTLCRQHKLDVVGFFIIGLPGDTRESVLATIDFACKSGIDFASFNMAMPRLGSRMRDDAIKSGIADASDLAPDSSRGTPRWREQPLANEEIIALQKQAFRSFYLRPGYLLKRLTRLSTFHQFYNFAREGAHLFLG